MICSASTMNWRVNSHNEFGVSESQARNIIASETQKEYTDRLQAILLQWQKRNEADER